MATYPRRPVPNVNPIFYLATGRPLHSGPYSKHEISTWAVQARHLIERDELARSAIDVLIKGYRTVPNVDMDKVYRCWLALYNRLQPAMHLPDLNTTFMLPNARPGEHIRRCDVLFAQYFGSTMAKRQAEDNNLDPYIQAAGLQRKVGLIEEVAKANRASDNPIKTATNLYRFAETTARVDNQPIEIIIDSRKRRETVSTVTSHTEPEVGRMIKLRQAGRADALRGNTTLINAYRSNLQRALEGAAADLTSLSATGKFRYSWSVTMPVVIDNVHTFRSFDEDLVREFVRREWIPRHYMMKPRIRAISKEGIDPTWAYEEYIEASHELTDEEKDAFDILLVLIVRWMRDLGKARVPAVRVKFKRVGTGPNKGEVSIDFRNVDHDTFIELCNETRGLLSTDSSHEANVAMNNIPIRIKGNEGAMDVSHYGAEISPTDSYEYYVPFDLSVTYVMPQLTMAKSKAEQKRRYTFTYACNACEAGECLQAALDYMEPKPTELELEGVAQMPLECGAEVIMHEVMSRPWLLLDYIKPTRVSVLAHSLDVDPKVPYWMVDLKKVIVIYIEEGHAYRMVAMDPPRVDPVRSVEWHTTLEAIPINKALDWQLVKHVKLDYSCEVIDGSNGPVKHGLVDVDCKQVIVKVGDAYGLIKDIAVAKKTKGGTEQPKEFRCNDLLLAPAPSERLLDNASSPYIVNDEPNEDKPGEYWILPWLVIATIAFRWRKCSIQRLTKLLDSGELVRECLAYYTTRFDKGVSDMKAFVAQLGIPKVYLVRYRKNDLVFDYPKDTRMSKEDFMGELLSGAVAYCWHKGAHHLVLDMYGRAGDTIYSAEGCFKLERKPTLEETLASLATDEITMMSKPTIDKALDQLRYTSYVLYDGFKRKPQDTYPSPLVARDHKSLVTGEDYQLKLYRDTDGVLWCITGNLLTYYPPEKGKSIILTYDAETINIPGYDKLKPVSSTHPYVFHVNELKQDKIIDHAFEGSDCGHQLMKWLYRFCHYEHSAATVYMLGFNSSSFDIYALFRALISDSGFQFGTQGSNSRYLQVGSKILDLTVENLVVRDVRRFITGSLEKAAQAFKTTAAKTGWDHHVTQETFNNLSDHPSQRTIDRFINALAEMNSSVFVKNPDEETKKLTALQACHAYCANDCMVTLQLVQKLRQATYELTGGKLDVLEYMTISQAAATWCRTQMEEEQIKQIKPCNRECYEFLSLAAVAGKSEVAETAPKTMGIYQLLLGDVTSQYPFTMSECWFGVSQSENPEDDWIHEKGEDLRYDPNELGAYHIVITKNPCVPVVPLKRQDAQLGTHFWAYKGTFETKLFTPDLILIKYYGGEFTIKEKWVAKYVQQGIYAKSLMAFRREKQYMDCMGNKEKPIIAAEKKRLGLPSNVDLTEEQLKVLFPDGQKYNQALREVCKLFLNALSGKLEENLHIDKSLIACNDEEDPAALSRAFMRLRKAGIKDGIVMTSLAPTHTTDFLADMEHEPLEPMQLSWQVSLDEAIMKDKSVKSKFNGGLVYSWSRFIMMLALLGRSYRYGAAIATETDGHQFDREKYEQGFAAEFGPDVNPYDVPAPTDECLGRFMQGRTMRLGAFYCPAAAKVWAKAHNQPYQPKSYAIVNPHDLTDTSLRLETDFGDYTVEAGIEGGQFRSQTACWLGKKSYYLENKEGHEACCFKGFGSRSVDASRLVQWRREHPFADPGHDKDYQKLLDEVMQGPSCLKRGIYERLLSGQPVDVAERRFQGSIELLASDDCISPLRTSVVTKRISPPWWVSLRLRGKGQPESELQFPDANPGGYEPYDLSIPSLGRPLTQSEVCRIIAQLQAATPYDRSIGCSFVLCGRHYYARPKTIAFLLKPEVSRWLIENTSSQ